MAIETRKPAGSTPVDPGPFLAKVVSHLDPTHMGSLEVQILREVGGDSNSDGQLQIVKYLNPFYGSTGSEHVTDTDDFNNTQKSYGMWFVPPDPGTIVVVIFIGGDPGKGYWMGCVQDEGMNFMIPGLAATEFVISDTKTDDSERVPTAEYNKIVNGSSQDPTKTIKPQHPFAEWLITQGLIKDDARGITTSSARREVPSSVFGISTPGPLDKQSGAKRGRIGKAQHAIDSAFVSRLGGSTFVMDDGDDKFLRKTAPTDGPPEYADVLNNDTDGDPTRPHNELIRLRTRTGHQILLHNSEDLIYIGNSRGTSWIELSSDGKIDIYAEDSISVHTEQDLNFYAGRDINMQAGRNFNTKVAEEMHTHVVKDHVLIVDANQRIHIKKDLESTVAGSSHLTTAKNTEIKSGVKHIETAGQIHMNGPTATTAIIPKELKTHLLPTETDGSIGNIIMRRMPTHEPYPQHENLDPLAYKPEKTDRDIDGRYEGQSTSIKSPAEKWKKYGFVNDTFRKLQAD